jgi:hypothetical protein
LLIALITSLSLTSAAFHFDYRLGFRFAKTEKPAVASADNREQHLLLHTMTIYRYVKVRGDATSHQICRLTIPLEGHSFEHDPTPKSGFRLFTTWRKSRFLPSRHWTPSACVHTHRTAGGNCSDWDSGGTFVACSERGKAAGAAHSLPK